MVYNGLGRPGRQLTHRRPRALRNASRRSVDAQGRCRGGGRVAAVARRGELRRATMPGSPGRPGHKKRRDAEDGRGPTYVIQVPLRCRSAEYR